MLKSAFMVLAVALFCAVPSHAQQPAAQKSVVTVGVTSSPDMALLIFAVKGGFLAKEGVKAQLQVFDSSPAVLQGVVSGQADLSINTEPPQLATRARGGKIVQVMTGYLSGRQNGMVAGKTIRDPVDIVGKTIGVHRGTGSHYHLVYFLNRNKIPADKVSIKFIDAPDQIPALARGDIDAFFSWEPFLSKAAEAVPGARIVRRALDDGFSFTGNIAMREEMARNQPDVAVSVVKALIAASDALTANPLEAAKLVNETLRAPSVELLSQQIQLMTFPADFTRKVHVQQVSMAEWGAGIGLFPIKEPGRLVDELMYPAIIKKAASSRTDL
jgi:ABC-type nitrate/sulfonate/bicarbonate transport system substrate-binding protein